MYTHNLVRMKLKEAAKEFSFRQATQARIALILDLELGKTKLTRKEKAIMNSIAMNNDKYNTPLRVEIELADENPGYTPLFDPLPTPADYSVVKVTHANNNSRDN